MKRGSVSIFSVLILVILISIPGTARAVDEFKVSAYGNGHQIWFEAEAFDERNPAGNQYYRITGDPGAPKAPPGTFGQAINRSGGAGGMIRWTFDISAANGEGGTWYFWARIFNPDNLSDYMLVKDDPDDKEIPGGPPFPGGDAIPPFDNVDDRIFENTVENWGWWGKDEGATKELQDGENTMYIFHRQGSTAVLWDVFMWTDDPMYLPNDDDYINAQPEKTKPEAVLPLEKLSTTWGSIKSR